MLWLKYNADPDQTPENRLLRFTLPLLIICGAYLVLFSLLSWYFVVRVGGVLLPIPAFVLTLLSFGGLMLWYLGPLYRRLSRFKRQRLKQFGGTCTIITALTNVWLQQVNNDHFSNTLNLYDVSGITEYPQYRLFSLRDVSIDQENILSYADVHRSTKKKGPLYVFYAEVAAPFAVSPDKPVVWMVKRFTAENNEELLSVEQKQSLSIFRANCISRFKTAGYDTHHFVRIKEEGLELFPYMSKRGRRHILLQPDRIPVENPERRIQYFLASVLLFLYYLLHMMLYDRRA